MGDHYHYASEVQGAALDGHSHTPREIGAAEEHDLEMLKRDVRGAERGIAALERQAAEQTQRITFLEGSVAEWAQAHRELQGQVLTLLSQVSQLTDALARAIEQGRI